MTPVQQFNAPRRTEAQAVADRIRDRLTAHVAALAHAGAIDREIASELLAKINTGLAAIKADGTAQKILDKYFKSAP